MFLFFPWVTKMFFFFPFGCKMISKLRNDFHAIKMTCKMKRDLRKHFAKPREVVKMRREPRNHASKEESPFTRITHTKPLTPFLTSLNHQSPQLQLRRLCHLSRLLEQRLKSLSNPLTRSPQMHQLHMTLPLLDHLFTFCIYILVQIIPCFDVLYSEIGCITDDTSYIDIIFCLNLAFFYFLYSITLMFF